MGGNVFWGVSFTAAAARPPVAPAAPSAVLAPMTLRTRPATGPDDAGFTLVELLVVIVVIGILAAVVVFSVRGVGDKGLKAAVRADGRTLETAEQAYCAMKGRYADHDTLVNEGFLSERSRYHDVVLSDGGRCGSAGVGSGFVLVCRADPDACSGTAPPGGGGIVGPLPSGPLAFSATGVSGGGFQNVVAVAPGPSDTVLSGGDVSGVNRSTDGGATYAPSNLGLTGSGLKIAALAYDPGVPATVYAGTGEKGTSGGFYRSLDDGVTWELRSDVPRFSGNHTDGVGIPENHPRPTGNLIAVDPGSGAIWVATFKDGVMRSTDGGASWTTMGLVDAHLRTLALDPTRPGVVYAGTYDDGVHQASPATGGAFTRLAGGAPDHAEEIVVVGGVALVAAGGEGVFRSYDGGATWQAANSGLAVNGTTWYTAIAGSVTPQGGLRLYAGDLEPVKPAGSSAYASVYRSGDGGDTWTAVTADGQAHREVLGTTEEWWVADAYGSSMLDKPSAVVSQIAVDPSDGSVLVSGHGGLWRSADSGANWYPSVQGMGVTVNSDVVADPRVPGRIYAANTDYRLLASPDYFVHVAKNRPAGSESMGTDVALDPSTLPSTLYLSVGDRDVNAGGEVYLNPDPTTASGWTATGLGAAAGGGRALGVVVHQVDGGPVVLAAVEDSGIWRRERGTWSRVEAGALTGAQPRPPFARFWWPPGSSVVYLYDRASGVWRSNDAGRSWTRIWVQPSAQSRVRTGFVAGDPRDPARLYVSVGDEGVFRLDGASSGTVGSGITPLGLGTFAHPGPITVDAGGTLWATEIATEDGPARLAFSTDAGATWTDVADAAYRAAAGVPSAVEIAPDGRLYVSLAFNGVISGRPRL